MCVQYFKFVALPVPEIIIIGGTQKIWAVRGYAHAPFCPKFLMDFCSDGLLNEPAKFEIRSFTRSWDNRGTQKNCEVHALFSPKFLIGFCSNGPCEFSGEI